MGIFCLNNGRSAQLGSINLHGKRNRRYPQAGNTLLSYLDSRTTALTIAECAKLLHIGHNTLYRHAQTGKFPTFEVAGMVRVDPAALAAHIRATTKTGPIDRRCRRAA